MNAHAPTLPSSVSTSATPRQAQPHRVDDGGGSSRQLLAAGLTLASWAVSAGLVAVGSWLAWHAQDHMRPKAPPPLSVLAKPALAELDADDYLRGRDIYAASCTLCHGAGGRGVAGLGKALATSEFVAGMYDGGLVAFIAHGRAADDPYNTTRVAMPPRGGNPLLTDADLAKVVIYLRGMQDRRRVPVVALNAPPPAAPTPPPPSEDAKAEALAAAGGDAELAGWIASGNAIFHSSCVACHGRGGVGVLGNGKALVNNPFVRSLDDDGLVAFLTKGRTPTDPANTTGIQMPPKGGNPALSEDDLLDIVSYLRTLGNAPAVPLTAK